jgi:Tfp pilus assembly protein PilE
MKAFTLLECLIYVGLFSIILQGSFLSFYTFTLTIDRAQTKAHLQNEGNFILHRFSYDQKQTISKNDIVVLIGTKENVSEVTTAIQNSTSLPRFISVHFTLSAHDRSGKVILESFNGSWYATP